MIRLWGVLNHQGIKLKKVFSIKSSRRFLHSHESSPNISKIDKYLQFEKQIQTEFSQHNKTDCLAYLNELYKKFQNVVHVDFVSNSRLTIFWDELFDVNTTSHIRTCLDYVNKHNNFKEMKSFLIKNLDSYNDKEIALILKMYGTIENNKNDSNSAKLIEKLNDHCLKNIENFDLNDINNVSDVLVKTLKDTEFAKQSFTRVYEELLNERKPIEFNQLENDHTGKFEAKMREHDLKNDYFWLKLNVYRKYYKIFKTEWCNKIIENTINVSSNNLVNVESTEYKVNFLVSLLHSSRLVVNNDFNLNMIAKEKLNESLKRINLDNLFINLDLVEYKQDLIKSFTLLRNHHLIEAGNLDYLLNYFAVKLRSDELTKVEFFIYLDIFFKLASKKSFNNHDYLVFKRTHKKERAIGSKSKVLRVKYFLSNISKDLKREISNRFDKFVVEFDPLCLESSSNGFYIIYCIHSMPNKALMLFYKKLIELSSISMFNNKILPIIPLMNILSDDVSTKSLELQICDLVLNSKQKIDETPYNVLNLVQLIMLNRETLGENFYFTLKSIKETLSSNFSTFEMISIYYLFEKNFENFLNYDKSKALSIFDMLYSKLIDELNSDKLVVFSYDTKVLTISLIKQLYSYYYKNLLSIDEVNRTLNSVTRLQLKSANEEDLSEFWYQKETKWTTLNYKYELAAILLSKSRFHSIENMDKIWSFLILFLQFDLQNKNSSFESNIGILNEIWKIYEQFDYTNNEKYKAEKDLFKDLSRRFYERHRLYFDSNAKLLCMFVSSLTNLDCYLSEPFLDFFQIYESFNFSNLGTRLRISNILHYITIKNPNHDMFKYNINCTTKVNLKFHEDFKSFFHIYMSKKYYKEFSDGQSLNKESPMLIAIDKKSHKIVSPNSKASKLMISFSLLDKMFYYQNDSILLKNISNQLEFSKSHKIIVSEDEFYSNGANYEKIFEKKIKNFIDNLKK